MSSIRIAKSTFKQNCCLKYKKGIKYLLISKTFLILLLFATIFNISSAICIRSDASISLDAPQIKTANNRSTEKEKVIFQRMFGKTNSYLFDEFKSLSKKLDIDQKNYNSSKFPTEKFIEDILNKKKRIDTGREFINDVVEHNNRLDYYELYIKLAQQNGYIVTGYYDYITKYKHSKQRVLILRHDIDARDDATRSMLEIEKRNNVKATYYFRWNTFDEALIKEIVQQGSEVGLHYETIATYYLKNNRNEINLEDITKCREILKTEIKSFKTRTGIDIKTVASHGNPINRKIGVPNYFLVMNQKYSDFGIVGETYDENIMSNYISEYICDGEITKNEGFSYPANPIDSILKKKKVIEFLSHPNHWNYDCYKRTKYYLDLIYGVKFD